MKRIIFLTSMLMLCTLAGAQTNYSQRLLTMDNGLLSNTVRTIIQDPNGFVWAGTENGLCRYDGIKVNTYPIPDIETEQQISSIVCEKNGDLLIGSSMGVFRFSYVKETFTELPLELKAPVTHLTFDRDSNLWVSTNGGGVVRYTEKNNDEPETEYYALNETGGKADFIYSDADNQQWVICRSVQPGLLRLNKSTNTFRPFERSGATPAQGATSMLQTSDGNRWLGTWENGLMRIMDDGTLEPMPSSAIGHYQHIRTLYELSANQLLLGCDDGLWAFDTHQRTYTLYLPQRFVTTIMLDHEGGLWTGAMYGGIAYQSPIAYRFDSNATGRTARMAEDRWGRVWTTSDELGLKCYQKDMPVGNIRGIEKLKGIKVHALCMDGDDIWIGTYSNGIYVFAINSGTLRHYDASNDEHSLYDPNSCTMLRDRQGNIWVATMEGLCRYDRKNDRFDRIAKQQSVPIDMKDDGKGGLWVATQGGGIWCYQQGSKQTTTYQRLNDNEQSLSANIVNCVFVDNKNRVWAGTQGGLCQFDTAIGNFRRIPLDMPRLAITAITEDQGSLWLSGDCGILKYTPGEGMQRFTRQDGLENEQFEPNSVLKASDGRIYFGSSSGINAFYPYKIKINQQSAPVVITELEINNQPINVGQWHLPENLLVIKKLDLWNADMVFSLSFASLSYCSPEKNIYAYMLEGFDKKWNYVGNEHKATYTNLAPGTYTFRVRATNNDGIWSKQEARLTIVVHPPFWWNIYAKILYVILFIVLITLFIRLRLMMAEHRHRKEMEQLNMAKQEEIRNARVEFFTTIAHEIRTPVSLIIAPMEKLKSLDLKPQGDSKGQTAIANPTLDTLHNNLDVIDRNAHRLLELVNQLLDFRKVEENRQVLDFAPQNIKALLRSIVANFEPIFEQNGQQFEAVYPDDQLTAVVNRDGLVKIMTNLLSNANKYAHGKIKLTCRELPETKQFCIEVKDNGEGIDSEDIKHVFDPFYQAKHSKPGSGIGLGVVKKIAELHHGSVSVKSKVGKGSTFTVILPMMQAVSGEQATAEQKPQTTEGQPTEATTAEVVEKPTMLIIDDNKDMLTFLVTTFMDQFEVIPTHDGSEALKIIKNSLVVKDGQTPTSAIDIIISDWMMAEMDGPELCSRLRQNAATSNLPFILLTAKTDSQSKVQAMQAGVDAFIEKPFAVKYLEACINNLLSRKSKSSAQ